MEGLGEFLKKGRQTASLSLEDLSQRTRIRIENLQSLEREDLDNLPSDAYVRGFVRQVCREVGLAPQDGIARYEMLRASSGPPDEITWSEDRAEETAGRLERALEDPERVVRLAKSGTRWAGMGAAGLVALVVVVFTWQALRSKPSPGRAEGKAKEIAAAVDNVTKKVDAPVVKQEPAALRKDARAEERSVPPEVKKRITPPESESRTTIRADTGAFPVSLPDVQTPAPKPRAREPEVAAVVEATAPRKVEAEVSPPPVENRTEDRAAPRPEPSVARPVEQPAARPASPSSTEDRVVLEVEAVRSVDITVLLDGTGQPRRASLLPGERRRWKAEQHFVLSATDGGAVRIYVNGRDLGLAGDSGHQVVRTLR